MYCFDIIRSIEHICSFVRLFFFFVSVLIVGVVILREIKFRFKLNAWFVGVKK